MATRSSARHNFTLTETLRLQSAASQPVHILPPPRRIPAVDPVTEHDEMALPARCSCEARYAVA